MTGAYGWWNARVTELPPSRFYADLAMLGSVKPSLPIGLGQALARLTCAQRALALICTLLGSARRLLRSIELG